MRLNFRILFICILFFSPSSWALEGNACSSLKELASSTIESCNSIINSNSDREQIAIAYRIRGILNLQNGMVENAFQDFTSSIDTYSNSAGAHSNRATAAMALRRYDTAISDATTALSIQPDIVGALSTRAQSYFNLKEYKLAFKDATDIIRLDKDNPIGFLIRHEFYLMDGDYTMALADLMRLNELKYTPNIFTFKLAMLHSDLKQYDRAINTLKPLLQFNPKHYPARLMLIVWLSELGRFDELQQEIAQYLDYRPDSLVAKLIVANLAELSGRSNDAKKLRDMIKESDDLKDISTEDIFDYCVGINVITNDKGELFGDKLSTCRKLLSKY